jgi:hypothetical protein
MVNLSHWRPAPKACQKRRNEKIPSPRKFFPSNGPCSAVDSAGKPQNKKGSPKAPLNRRTPSYIFPGVADFDSFDFFSTFFPIFFLPCFFAACFFACLFLACNFPLFFFFIEWDTLAAEGTGVESPAKAIPAVAAKRKNAAAKTIIFFISFSRMFFKLLCIGQKTDIQGRPSFPKGPDDPPGRARDGLKS